MTLFLPKGMRPPGLHPAAPRVIYKTVRKNLSHEGRIGRIDRLETLNEFHAFSEDFHARLPRLDPEQAGSLHNRGFLPDKGALFDLDDPGRADQYLSDLQARILPLVNGTRQAALQNRLLFWRLYRASLDMAALVGSVQSSRLALSEDADLPGPFLIRPALTSDATPPLCHADLSDIDCDGPERIILRMPQWQAGQRVLRVAVIHDPGTGLPVILGAVAFPLTDTLGPWQIDGAGAMLRVARIDPETGLCGPYGVMVRDSLTPPPQADPDPAPPVANWWALRIALTGALARVPLLGIAQFDILETADSGIVLDATDRLDTASLQRHGPLMSSDVAIRFLREFGL